MSNGQKGEVGALVYGAVPRARLMPPEVSIRRRESAQRRSLIAILVLVIVATGSGVAASFLFAADAQQRLQAERAVTEQLLATQLQYADVTTLRADIQVITDLRSQLGATELLWAEVLAPYLGVIGDDAEILSLSVAGDEPGAPQLGVTGPLRQPRVATVSMSVATVDLPSPWIWYRAWQRLDTFADASIDRVVEGSAGYETFITINLNGDAASLRFGAPLAGVEQTQEDQ